MITSLFCLLSCNLIPYVLSTISTLTKQFGISAGCKCVLSVCLSSKMHGVFLKLFKHAWPSHLRKIQKWYFIFYKELTHFCFDLSKH